MKSQDLPTYRARLATLASLRPLLAAYLEPVPSDETLRLWFEKAGIPRLKANPHAKRGGGPAFYAVASIERFLKERGSLRGNLPPVAAKPPGRTNPTTDKGAAL